MKRLILLVFFLLAWCEIASAQCSNTSYGAGFTCVQEKMLENAGTGTAVSITFGATVTANNPVYVSGFSCNDSGCSADGTYTYSMSGSAQSSCTQDASAPLNSTNHRRWTGFVCTGAAGTGLTLTCSATCWYLGIGASEWTGGILASPFDGNGVIASGSGASATVTKSVGSTTDLFYCSTSNDISAAITPGSGFTEIGEDAAGYEQEAKTGVSGSQSGASSWTGTANWSIYCTAFKASAAPSAIFMLGHTVIWFGLIGFLSAGFYLMRGNHKPHLGYVVGSDRGMAGYFHTSQAMSLYGITLDMVQEKEKAPINSTDTMDV